MSSSLPSTRREESTLPESVTQPFSLTRPASLTSTAVTRMTAPPDLKRMEEELAALSRDKEEAIKAQEFERAAGVRDKEVQLRAAYETAKEAWADGSHRSDGEETVTDAHIADVVTEWTEIPVSRLLESEG